MKNAFDPFPNAVEPAIQAFGILIMLIGSAGCPNQVIGLIQDLSLPLQSQEAFVAKEIAEGEVVDHGFRCGTLIGISRN